MIARLLKITCISRPVSRIASRTAAWCGSQVATITRPTEIGPTPRRVKASTNASEAGPARSVSERSAGR